MGKSMLEFNGISRTFPGPEGRVQALTDASFRIDAGEFVVVRGPSGCGKTTLLLVAGALLRPNAGQVLVAGTDPYALPPNRRSTFRAQTLGFVFQQFHLVPYLTVLENVLAPTLARRTDGAADRARELIRHFDLEERLNHVPAQLSTGERQRTALARALLNRPALILADEPTGNLDEDNGRRVIRYLSEFVEDGGAVLMVTHAPEIGEVRHREMYMVGGRLESSGERGTECRKESAT